MKKWEVVLAVLMCLVMVTMITISIINSIPCQPTDCQLICPTTDAEPTVEDDRVYIKHVTVVFAEGEMRCVVEELCGNTFEQASNSKGAASFIIESYAKHGQNIFSLSEGGEEKSITFGELMELVNSYEFSRN